MIDVQNAEKKDNKSKLSEDDMQEAREIVEVQNKIFTQPFGVLLHDIISDLNETDYDEELIHKLSNLINKRKIGDCVMALTYLLSIVVSEKNFMTALNAVESECNDKVQNYIG